MRRRFVVRGTVQGVGFRPWAFRHARRLGLVGSATNDRAGLVLDVEGEPAAVAELRRLLDESPPPLAVVDAIDETALVAAGAPTFVIADSAGGSGPAVAVPADVATCAACLAEVADPNDRRYRYPFTNCTDCGPRYTIIRSLPYDRASTTMAAFAMCHDCRREYEDPADRRFHAEPTACPVCGPVLRWESASDAGDGADGEAALSRAVTCLSAGGAVAVKGVGGYHLAVVADDEEAVARLRTRKARDDKPFAVMVATAADAEALVVLGAAARRALVSPAAPIVVAPRRDGAPSGSGAARVASGVAPGSADLGVLLAYTPLHHLLLEAVGRALVMTSGNRTDEPIAVDAAGAREQLAGLADGFLHHDRPIDVRADDSVVRPVGDGVQVIRRSRGYAPAPLLLPAVSTGSVLAVGAERKTTVAVAAGGTVVASHHLGDLEHAAAYAGFTAAIARLCELTGIEPELVAHDRHPEYLSTKWALDDGRETVAVQHHHAHVASCLVDHERSDPVIGVAFDGLGFGDDGGLWGGEILLADLAGYRRLAHLRQVPLPGGAAAVREPWRMALAWVEVAVGPEAAASLGPALDPRWAAVRALAVAPATPRTSSGGRLFDAVASLADLCQRSTFEGQAAMALEDAARSAVADDLASPDAGAWVGERPDSASSAPRVLDPSPLVGEAFASRLAGRSASAIAALFHRRLAAGVARAAVDCARAEGVGTVALTGGVFQNRVLTELVAEGVAACGLEVLVHRRVPPNDGGISIGQAAVVAASS